MKTSLYTILCIVIRLGVVIVGVEALLGLPGWLYAVHENANAIDIYAPLAIWAAIMLGASVLWLYPGLLARAAAGRSANQVFESPISPGQMMYIAFAILGTYFVLKGLWSAAYEEMRLAWLTKITGSVEGFGMERVKSWISIVSDCVAVVLGLVLVLRARGLAELIQRLRYGNRQWQEQQ
jgi:hypothetical protein